MSAMTMACAPPPGHLTPYHRNCKGQVYPGNRTWEEPIPCACYCHTPQQDQPRRRPPTKGALV